ncbi:MAG: hypothetical protein JWO51_2872 [Rhodospirillales bacterium]|nr:hypothetical protein [Rhodospirillales bacterium]
MFSSSDLVVRARAFLLMFNVAREVQTPVPRVGCLA